MSLIKGNTRGATWGTSGAGSGSFVGSGIITRVRVRKDGQVFEHKDENNETIAAILHDEMNELQLDIDTGTGSILPARGDQISAFGLTGYVLSAEKTGARGSVQGISVTAKKWALVT